MDTSIGWFLRHRTAAQAAQGPRAALVRLLVDPSGHDERVTSSPAPPSPTGRAAWHEGPLVALDVETTGTDPEADVVTAATVAVDEPGQPLWVREWLLAGQPAGQGGDGLAPDLLQRYGLPAPEVVRDVVRTLEQAFDDGATLVGHNVVFDLLMLRAESDRVGQPRLQLRGPVVDTYVLDVHLEPEESDRFLLSVAGRCGVEPYDGRWSAETDAVTSLHLARAMAARHEELRTGGAEGLVAQQQVWSFDAIAEARRAEMSVAPREAGSGPGWPLRKRSWTTNLAAGWRRGVRNAVGMPPDHADDCAHDGCHNAVVRQGALCRHHDR